MTQHQQFLDHLLRESQRFRDVLADTPPANPVPTCPDWHADDLLWHLGEVQWFWGEIVEHRHTHREQVSATDEKRSPRPRDRAGLLAFYDRASERLHRELLDTPPQTELWMWADDRSAAYIARRQAHEALIHRLDAELTAGDRSPMDPALSADGIDEALRIMRGVEPEDGLVLTTISDPVVISCSDVPGSWTVTPTHVTGTDDGDPVDVARFVVRDGDDLTATARILGTAADLDCWLWNRPPTGGLERHGDLAALGAVDRVLDASVD
jgi:uncharacterized protein (TIGR03083 family)